MAYTKPELRERLKARIKAGSKGGKPGQWSARKAQLLAKAYKEKGGGYKGGKASTVSAAPATSPQESVAKSGDTYIFVPGSRKGKALTSDDFLASYMQQMLTGDTPKIQSSFDPVGMLTQAFSQTPNYLT